MEKNLSTPPRPDWLPSSCPAHGGNREVDPVKWSITINQWNRFVDACKSTSKWADLKSVGDSYKPAGSVSGYEVCNHFVKPWSAKTGAGVALLMNEVPENTDVMLSHSWAEDMEQVQEILTNLREKHGGPKPDTLNRMVASGHVDAESFEPETRVWFCIFANYQCEDEAGPTITEQLEKDPFGNVIRSSSTRKMVVLITSITEVYERLWCCFEIDVAVTERGMRDSEQKQKDFVQMAFSKASVEAANLNPKLAEIDTSKAKCGRQSDADMITKQILAKEGGFARLTNVLEDVRAGYHKTKNEFGHFRNFRSGSSACLALPTSTASKRERNVFGEEFTGIIESYQSGFQEKGYIVADSYATLPQEAKVLLRKVAAQEREAEVAEFKKRWSAMQVFEDKAEFEKAQAVFDEYMKTGEGPPPTPPMMVPDSVDRSEMLPFSVADFDQYLKWVEDDIFEEVLRKIIKGRLVTFQVFTDSDGAGACALKLVDD